MQNSLSWVKSRTIINRKAHPWQNTTPFLGQTIVCGISRVCGMDFEIGPFQIILIKYFHEHNYTRHGGFFERWKRGWKLFDQINIFQNSPLQMKLKKRTIKMTMMENVFCWLKSFPFWRKRKEKRELNPSSHFSFATWILLVLVFVSSFFMSRGKVSLSRGIKLSYTRFSKLRWHHQMRKKHGVGWVWNIKYMRVIIWGL